MNINNNLEARFPLNGSRTIEEPYPLNRDYEVSATFLMDSTNAKSLYDQYYIGGSEFNAMVQIEAVAGRNPKILFALAKLFGKQLMLPGLKEMLPAQQRKLLDSHRLIMK